MRVHRFLLPLVIVLAVIVLSACKMPASTPPATSPVSGVSSPQVPGETMGLFETFATQTAIAAQGQATQPPVEATVPQPALGAPTDTPAAGAPQETQPPPPPPTGTPEPVVVPPPTPGLPASYTLQSNEFPYCIARRFNLNPADLLSFNGLTVNSRVFPGDTLKIPQDARPFPGDRALRSHPTTYTVQSGDDIYKVACAFGDVDPMVIAQVNGVGEPYTLSAGQTLQIP